MLAIHTANNTTHLSCPDLVFATVLWNKDVLQLAEGETEDELDELYALQAREAGIEDEVQDTIEPDTHKVPDAGSALSISSPQCSSVSLHSSLSTNITDRSRTSRDTQTDASSLSANQSTSRLSSSNFATLKHSVYDSIIEDMRPRLPSRSSSAESSASAFSFAFRSKNKRPKSSHRRGGSLSIFRKSPSQQCYSRTCHGFNTASNPDIAQKSLRYPKATSLSSYSPIPSQPLGCGHSLNEFAIRMHIKEAVERDQEIPPSCCGIPIPASVLNRVMSPAEMEDLERKLAASYGIDRKASANVTEISPVTSRRAKPAPLELNMKIPSSGPLLSPLRLDLGLATQSSICLLPPKQDPLPSQKRPSHERPGSQDLDIDQTECAIQDEAFVSLRKQQREQYSKAREYEYRQRRVIEVHYDRLRTDYWALHQQQRIDIEDEHKHAIEILEEMQMDREVELCALHSEERQNVATALKYMEAYCVVVPLGSLPPTMPAGSSRIVTDQDRLKLQRQYMIRDGLEKKHEAAINVLRAKQERAVKNKQKKQHEEIVLDDRNFEKELNALAVLQAKDLEKLEDIAASRRKRLDSRWRIKFELRAKELKGQEKQWSSTMVRPEWPDPLMSASELRTDAGKDLDALFRAGKLKPSSNWKAY